MITKCQVSIHINLKNIKNTCVMRCSKICSYKNIKKDREDNISVKRTERTNAQHVVEAGFH